MESGKTEGKSSWPFKARLDETSSRILIYLFVIRASVKDTDCGTSMALVTYKGKRPDTVSLLLAPGPD